VGYLIDTSSKNLAMNSNGQWNSTCANDNMTYGSSLYNQLNGQQCASGNLSGYNGTYATCACGADFCNSPSLLGNQLMTKLNRCLLNWVDVLKEHISHV
jgi:hypothetical protein